MTDLSFELPRPAAAKERLVYIARAVDRRSKSSSRQAGEYLAAKIVEAGFIPVDPVVTPFPGFEEQNLQEAYARVLSDLAWLRRCDALVADMSIKDWPYVGCVCELVYARLYDVPSIVITGENELLGDRIWLRYHADFVCRDADAAIESLLGLPRGARPRRRPGS